MSSISLWWHMMIKGRPEMTIQAINSLQGLYDGLVIAVDDREDSDEVFEVLQHYPNVDAFRHHFEYFEGLTPGRNEGLDRIPSHGVDYIGWSDSDEILISNPQEVRKWLADIRPDAVRAPLKFVYARCWYVEGELGVRHRIWKYGTRRWERSVHEHPEPINRIDNFVDHDILFHHINDDPSTYKSDYIIELMQIEIEKGSLDFMWMQAREYAVKGGY